MQWGGIINGEHNKTDTKRQRPGLRCVSMHATASQQVKCTTLQGDDWPCYFAGCPVVECERGMAFVTVSLTRCWRRLRVNLRHASEHSSVPEAAGGADLPRSSAARGLAVNRSRATPDQQAGQDDRLCRRSVGSGGMHIGAACRRLCPKQKATLEWTAAAQVLAVCAYSCKVCP